MSKDGEAREILRRTSILTSSLFLTPCGEEEAKIDGEEDTSIEIRGIRDLWEGKGKKQREEEVVDKKNRRRTRSFGAVRGTTWQVKETLLESCKLKRTFNLFRCQFITFSVQWCTLLIFQVSLEKNATLD